MKHLTERITALPAKQQELLLQRLRQHGAPQPARSGPALVRYQANPAARARLFCFPYAGGGASVFRQWAAFFPREIEVCGIQLPGRETRLNEQAHLRMEPLLEELSAALPPLLDRPFAFFGHSMGALVAFALAQRLRRDHGLLPLQLYLAAYRAPHLPTPHIKIYHLPTEVFKVVLRADGIAEAILQNDELMQVMLPTLRADLELCDTYEHAETAPIACPLAIFGGTEDVRVRVEDLNVWSRHTSAECSVTMLPGSHFFLHSAQDQLVRLIAEHLSERATAGTAAVLAGS